MSEKLRPLKPLTKDEVDKLTTFASEQGRGLVHRPGYAYEMARLLERFEAHPAECHGIDPEDSSETDGGTVRISSRSPYVTGGASATVEELDAVSHRISGNYARELAQDQKRASALDGTPVHEHIFDRLHGLCRCGESKDDRG